VKATVRTLALVALTVAAGCTCGSEPSVDAPPPMAATPAPTPAPATGWARVASVPEHGVPAAVAFERGGDALWVVTPDGKRVHRVGPDGVVGERELLHRDGRVVSIVAVRDGDAVSITGLDAARKGLQSLTVPDGGGAAEPGFEALDSARPLGSLDLGPDGGRTVLDAAQRPIGDGLHPAVRGFAIPGGRRLRAGTTNAGPMLFATGDDGAPRRVLLGSIPKAEKVFVVGVDGAGLPWLLAETGAADARQKHLVRVDLAGRVLERAMPPEIDDTKGPAGPGKGSGKVAVAVHEDGRLAWVGPGEAGIEVHVYTPGVPGRGLPQVDLKPRGR